MRWMLTIFWLLALTALSPAQKSKEAAVNNDRSDLSGTWVLVMSSSSFSSKKDPRYDELTLVISQNARELKMVREIVKGKRGRSDEAIYHTDGRGEANPTIERSEIIKSKTKWKRGTLESRGTLRRKVQGDILIIETTERWELSPDGSMLTHWISYGPVETLSGKPTFVFSMFNTESIKRVFKRTPRS